MGSYPHTPLTNSKIRWDRDDRSFMLVVPMARLLALSRRMSRTSRSSLTQR